MENWIASPWNMYREDMGKMGKMGRFSHENHEICQYVAKTNPLKNAYPGIDLGWLGGTLPKMGVDGPPASQAPSGSPKARPKVSRPGRIKGDQRRSEDRGEELHDQDQEIRWN